MAKTRRARVIATHPLLARSTRDVVKWAVLYDDGMTRYIDRPKGKGRPR